MIIPNLFSIIFLLQNSGIFGALLDNEATDKELQDLSEQLLSKDVINEGGSITLYLQNKIYQNKPSEGPLLNFIQNTQGKKEPQTYIQLQNLFKEYEKTNSPQLRKEINTFLDQVIGTEVMKETIAFLNSHGMKMDKEAMKNYLDLIWFTPYQRGKGRQSSGFQHVFMAEGKDDMVQGLHNWLFYRQEEKRENLKYVGWSKHTPFKGYTSSIAKIQFYWNGKFKPSGSLFIGTSPELEIALYSVCFLYRSQNDCKVKLGSVPITIKTYTFTTNYKSVIASAYPVI